MALNGIPTWSTQACVWHLEMTWQDDDHHVTHDGIPISHVLHCDVLNHIIGTVGMSQITIDLAQLPLMDLHVG